MTQISAISVDHQRSKAGPSANVADDVKARAACRLMYARHGLKGALARQIADQLGVGVRSVNRWLHQFKTGGHKALERRRRSDAGLPRFYTVEQLNSVRQVAQRVVGRGLTREFRKLQLPGSFRTFYLWIGRLRRGDDSRERGRVA